MLFVCSSGGHLDQLEPLLSSAGSDWTVATFPTPDASSRVSASRLLALRYPTNRRLLVNVVNAFILSAFVRRSRPSIIISSGAAPTVSAAVVAAAYAIPHIYIEPVDRIHMPTVTARLLKRSQRTFFVTQWPTQLMGWPHRCPVRRSR